MVNLLFHFFFFLLHNAASDQVLHCLLLSQLFFFRDTSANNEIDLFNLQNKSAKELRCPNFMVNRVFSIA